MTRISVCLLLITPWLGSGLYHRRPAFLNVRVPCHRQVSTKLADTRDAEEHLQELEQAWANLQKKEKELLEENPDGMPPLDLVQKVIETAIDHTHTIEQIEEDHVSSAHKTLEKVLSEEEALEQELSLQATNDELEEAHPNSMGKNVENYVESRLQEAKEAELRARQDEDEAKRSLEQLQQKEWDLKMTLAELQEYKKEHKEA